MEQRSHSFDALIALHQRELWWYARALGAAPSRADDLVQESFVALWQALQRNTFEQKSDGQTASWLRTTLLRRELTARRTLKARPHDTLTPELAETLWRVWQPDNVAGPAAQALDECLLQLNERERHALHLQYTEERTLEEIGSLLELQASGARSLLKRIRAKLRDCIQGRLARREP